MKTTGNWIPIVLCAAAIFVISQNDQFTALFPWVPGETKEMIGHLGLYFLLGFFLARYLFRMGVGGVTALVLTANLSAVLGFYDEFHQSFVGGRGVQLFDIIMDLAGGTAGGLAYLAWAAARWLVVKSARPREPRLDLLVRHAAVALTVFVFILVPAAVCSVLIKDYVRALAMDGPVAAQRVLDRFLHTERPMVAPTGPTAPLNSTGQVARQAASAESLNEFALVAEMLSRTKKDESRLPVLPSSSIRSAEGGQAPQATGDPATFR